MSTPSSFLHRCLFCFLALVVAISPVTALPLHAQTDPAALTQGAYVAPGVTGQISYFHQDASGNLVAQTDEGGQVVWNATLRPFGQGEAQPLDEPLRFVDQPLEPDIGELGGFYELGARYYDPLTGRFLSPDPLPLRNVGLANPQGFNRYVYGLNNPFRYQDTSGDVPVETLLDAVDIVWSAYDLWDEPSWTNAGLLLWSVGATVIPYVPGAWVGKGTAKAGSKIAGHGDDVVEAATDVARRVPCSFEAQTLVATPEGQQPISKIEVGDLVFAYDERTGTTGTYTVTATMAHLDPVIVRLTLDGEQIQTTPEHPFFVNGSWVEAKDLQSGGWIQQFDRTPGRLQSVQIEERPQIMYDLTAAEAHTYFVGDEQWLVHNCTPRGLWKITREGTERVVRHGRFGTFHKSKSDGLWWSQDNAGHGESAWKVYKETSKGLEWIADADKFGDFILNKHKGDVGVFIPWKELSGVIIK